MARKDMRTAEKAQAAERRVKALELRKAGLSYAAIGKTLGVSDAQAYDDVKRILSEMLKERAEDIEHVRQMEVERVDALIAAVWARARGGRKHEDGSVEPPDLQAMDRVLKLMDRRARLLGLDLQKPDETKHAITINVKYGDQE